MRPGDLVARFGGDEFVVVCENVDEDAVVALAGRVSDALARPMRLGGVDIRPYASVGVTVQTAEHVAADELIRDCDIAMYQAKAGGKGRITVLDQQARAEARDKLRLVAELRDAIDRREITLMYQPIFNSVDGHPVAVEALARWTHAERGSISPATFVPLAEESGLIAGLGLLVLDETCRQLAEWDHLIGSSAPPRANVNVSALQLDDNLAGQVAAALERHRLDPSRISDRDHRVGPDEGPDLGPRRAAAAARHGHRAGDRRLRHRLLVAGLPPAPAGGLPEGRPVVRGGDGRRHPEIASAVIALAATLNLCTVAEGVETLEQAEQLTSLGATYLQGFSLAVPMTGGHAAAWFAAHGEDSR